MYRIAVCDDEPHMRAELRERIESYMAQRGRRCCVHTFQNGADFLEHPQADIVFLDIQMPGLSGMETARALRSAGSTSRIVFTTVLTDYVFDAFEVDAADYIVKPIDTERFCRTMDRILQADDTRDTQQLVLRSRDQVRIVPYRRIISCEIHGRKMEIRLTDGRTLTYNERMSSMERELGGGFFRCHRGCLVNLSHIAACADGMVTMSDGSKVPVSRLREKELRHAIMRHLGAAQT